MSPDEASAQGLPKGGVYQINQLGQIKTITSPPKRFDASEGERKSSGFLKRAINAETSFRNLGDVQPRGLVGQAVQDAAPNLSNVMSDAQRQQAVQAEREFIAAVLRYDSGAAIPPEEFVTNGQIYFPRPGDTPEVLEQKTRARLVAMQGLKDAGGRMTQDLVIPDFDAITEEVKPPAVRAPQTRDYYPQGAELGIDKAGRDDPFDRLEYLRDTYGITGEQESELTALLNANRGNQSVNADVVAGFYEQAYGENRAPPRARLEEMAEGVRAGKKWGFIDTSEARKAYESGLDQALEASGEDPTSDVNAAIFGAARGATFGFNDEITGAGAAIAAGLQGENPVTAYQVNRDLVRRQTERTREESPVVSIGSELAGGIVTGARVAGAPQTPGQAAKVGAAEGAVYGFGTGDGLGGSAGNALLGAAGGAVVSPIVQGGVQRATNALASRRAARQVDNAEELASASERTGVPLRRMDVDETQQGQRANLLQSEKTRNVIRDADTEDLEALERSVINSLGTETTPDAAGARVRVEALASRKGDREAAGEIYNATHKRVGGLSAPTPNANQAIGGQLREISSGGARANRNLIKFFEDVREDLLNGMTVEGLHNQRKQLSGAIASNNLDKTDAERRMLIVLDAVEQDIARALKDQPEALRSFTEANRLWRRQALFKERLLDKLVGPNPSNPRSDVEVARTVQNWAKSDPRRLRQIMRSIGDEGRSEIRSAIASSLGRDTRGNFSIARFLTHTGSGSGAKINDRTARLVFGDDGVRAIRDLRALAQAKETAASQTNRSQTGNIVQRTYRNLRTAMLGIFGFSEAGVTGGVVAPAAVNFISSLGEKRAARLLVNPDFTQWLRRTPATSEPKAIDRHFERLRGVASRTPGMAADVDAFERALISAVNDDSAARVAAEEQPEE